jgi:tetratricopeptide (TPR) repeat protein
MGTVFRVEHTEIGTPMALKLLKPELLQVPSIEERFNREARSAASLDDPHIVRVTDFGRTVDGNLFMVMELLEGVPLGAAAAHGLSQRETIGLVAEVLSALEHAHEQGVVHRDLKPDNIMLVERRGRRMVKILDFGLAKITDVGPGEAALTQAGMVFGTPRYMSPEQASGEPVDGRSDLYAVGVILYELFSKGPLFEGNTIAEILTKHITRPPPPFQIGPEAGVDGAQVQAVIERALEKDPSDRFQTAREFRAALLGTIGRSSAAPPPRAESGSAPGPLLLASPTAFAQTMMKDPSRLVSPARRLPRRALVAAGVILLAGAGFMVIPPLLVVVPTVDPFEQAMSAGEFEKAEKIASALVHEDPKSLKARLALAHVLFARGKREIAVDEYVKALKLDGYAALDERFQDNFRTLALDMEKPGRILVGAVSELADPAASPLLIEVAERASQPPVRRRAYEGLERMKQDGRLDAFTFLSEGLRKDGTDKCDTRRWYVERLARIEDKRVVPIFKKELSRKGGFLNLESTGDCMTELLERTIRKYE